MEDFLLKLADALCKEHSRGKFNDNSEEEVEGTDPPVASLTQGTNARASEAAARATPKWVFKLIPVPNWVSIALFVTKGVARHLLEDKLPLLKTGDYAPHEKKNHSRAASRYEEASSRSRSRGSGRTDLLQGGFDMKDHLLALAVSLLADNGEHNAAIEAVINSVRSMAP